MLPVVEAISMRVRCCCGRCSCSSSSCCCCYDSCWVSRKDASGAAATAAAAAARTIFSYLFCLLLWLRFWAVDVDVDDIGAKLATGNWQLACCVSVAAAAAAAAICAPWRQPTNLRFCCEPSPVCNFLYQFQESLLFCHLTNSTRPPAPVPIPVSPPHPNPIPMV